jgi:hypothetical protein
MISMISQESQTNHPGHDSYIVTSFSQTSSYLKKKEKKNPHPI